MLNISQYTLDTLKKKYTHIYNTVYNIILVLFCTLFRVFNIIYIYPARLKNKILLH